MNNENLKNGKQFRSGEEATREAGRKGGIASGVSRSFRSAMKKRIKSNPELIENMLNQLEEAVMEGNLKAFELILELVGESPKQMEIAIKKKELRLKEEAARSGTSGEKELPQLYAALDAEDDE